MEVARDQNGDGEPVALTRLELAHQLSQPLSVIKALSDEVYAEFPECFTEEGGLLRLNPDAQQLTQDRLPPDPNDISVKALMELLGAHHEQVTAAARRLSAEGTPHEGSLFRRRAEGEDICLYMKPELAADVSQAIRNRQARQRQREQQREVGERFNAFAEEMTAGETIDAQEFRKLVEIFGPDSGMDLIFQYRPEFKRAPVDMVSSFLTDYLGSFLVTKGKLDLDNLTLTAEFLSNPTLKNSLTEVVKQHCLTYYQQKKRDKPEKDDLSIISHRLDYLREKIGGMDNEDLLEILEAVEDYYSFLFFAIEKPDNFVDSITGDRPFPDLNQRINVGELLYDDKERGIERKRRLLIADDPGMGKSASAIMSKEQVGAKCALIISPGGMVETWKSYLSDRVGEDGKQIGYFKPGQAPRVLVVDSIDKLNDVESTDYDYIILSHGRLKPNYTHQLMSIGFDMLIVDEAHEFKNIQEGQKASELIALSDYIAQRKDTYTLMLTATPAPNKVSDIAMMLKVLYPGRFKNNEGVELDNKELALRIIKGDYIDLRSLLVPRMQRKLISETIKMPDLIERRIPLELSDKMQEIYELYLEEDELTSSEKIQRIRQFLNNPATLDSTPDVESIKAVAVGKALSEHFETEDRILMFVNDYVDNIISGEKTIHQSLNLPEDVEVRTLTGASKTHEREAGQFAFQAKDGKKMLLIVSGNIAGLGIDLSNANRVVFYNEPWNKSRFRQQVGRAYRPGREGPLNVDTYYFPNTLEEGMHLYIEAKDVAIQKLLHGIKLSQLEQDALIKEEQSQTDESIHDINPELAAYYYSSWQRMLLMFNYVKEIGEEDFTQKFLPDHGAEYASTYRELGNRSYQANAARLNGTMIAEHFDAKRLKPADVKILDLASGPEMLKAHIPEEFAHSVMSLDINRQHFVEPGTKRIVSSMITLPVRDKSMDYVNLSLALHYTKQLIKHGIHERAETLAEINRVLKRGGRATITMLYSNDFEDPKKLEESLGQLGFRISKRNTGEVKSGDTFKARILTVEKVRDVAPLSEASNAHIQKVSSGLKLIKTADRVKDTRKVVDEFWVKGQQRIKARLNASDREVLAEENEILGTMQALKKKHTTIKDIPAEEVIMSGFSRIFNGQKHVLFARLRAAIGAVVLR